MIPPVVSGPGLPPPAPLVGMMPPPAPVVWNREGASFDPQAVANPAIEMTQQLNQAVFVCIVSSSRQRAFACFQGIRDRGPPEGRLGQVEQKPYHLCSLE
jgi:hypothetical protein